MVGDATDPSPVLADQSFLTTHAARPGTDEEPMKVLIAPDKFKGSLTAAQVVHHLGSGLHAARHRRTTGCRWPTAATAASPPRSRQASVRRGRRRRGHRRTPPRRDRLRRRHRRRRGRQHLRAAHPARRPPGAAAASSAGLGDAVRAALQLDAKRIVLALGGSASTDGGAGMLAVLGAVFRDAAGQAGDSRRRLARPDPHRRPHRPARPEPDRDRHRQRRAEPADRAGRGSRRLRAAEGRRPEHRSSSRRRPGPPRRPPGRRGYPARTRGSPHTAGAGAAGGLGFAGLLLGGHACPAPTSSSTCCTSTPTSTAATS